MNDEQTNKTDTQGTDPNRADKKPISEYDKALELVKRREEASKVELEILERKERLATNALLGGDSGGHIESNLSEEDIKKKGAKEFWKGTQIEGAIERHG